MTRVCATCPTYLSRYNPDDHCAKCRGETFRDAPVKLSAAQVLPSRREVKRMTARVKPKPKPRFVPNPMAATPGQLAAVAELGETIGRLIEMEANG